jgi:hypothetical protein
VQKVIAKPEVKIEKGSVAKMRKEFLATGKAIPAIRRDIKGDVQDKLKGFETALKQAASSKKTEAEKLCKKATANLNSNEDAWECSLHFIKNCFSCRDTFGEHESEDDEDWMNATLKFEKEVGANVFKPKIDDYTVIDPRSALKSDIFGRDLQVLGDIESRKRRNWAEKSTRSVKRADDQYIND